MKDTYCPKCRTHLLISESLENSRYLKCTTCNTSFKNPLLEKKKKVNPLEKVYSQESNENTNTKSNTLFFFALAALVILVIFINTIEQPPIDKYNCKILDTKVSQPFKKVFRIQVPHRLLREELSEIANYLKKENSDFERLFIFYYLPDMSVSKDIAWAYTHYNTDLQINMGASQNEVDRMKESAKAVKGKKIGEWFDSTPYSEASIIIVMNGSNYELHKTYKDGSNSKNTLKRFKRKGLVAFNLKNYSSEYVVIESNGKLGYYDEDGLIVYCKAVN